ncbi:MAG: hybrid sensor histidine kinase/response regulator [Bacteroidota bacterium]
MEEIKLLCFEADPNMAQLLHLRLGRLGLKLKLVEHAEEGLELIREMSFDLVILDHYMPTKSGFTILEEIQALSLDLPVVYVSRINDTKIAVDAIKKGALDYVAKDNPEVFVRKIEHNLLDWLHIHKEKREQLNLIADLKNYAQTVAHDLKNPLSTLKALTSLLSIDDNNELAITKYASAIAITVDKMRGIVDELLLMASTKKADVQFRAIDSSQLVGNAIERLEYLIKDRGAEIKVPSSFPLAIGYPAWVEEIWVNFISNALKYGGKKPKIEIDWDELSDGRIRFWVIDHGPGVPHEKQERLFQPLTRLDYSQTNGHGLGLSIVRRIAEKLNGEVGLISEESQGARFYFVLPAVAQENSSINFQTQDPPLLHKAS